MKCKSDDFYTIQTLHRGGFCQFPFHWAKYQNQPYFKIYMTGEVVFLHCTEACFTSFLSGGINIIIRHSSKSIKAVKLSFCQNDSPIGESFWRKDSLITCILFELWLIIIFSPQERKLANHTSVHWCEIEFLWNESSYFTNLSPAQIEMINAGHKSLPIVIWP